MMKKQVLFVVLDQFADYEYPFLATALQGRILDKTSEYEVKTLSISKAPIKSMGGFTVLPDYGVEDYPADYAALVLIGGNSWRTDEAKQIAPLLKTAYSAGKVVAAICDATVFLGMNGLLNERKHTSNTLENLMEGAGDNYTGKDNYINQQAVRDGNLITANGTAYLEFTTEVLTALEAYPADYIENNHQFYKLGFVEIIKLRQEQSV
ncbi:glutamine amidotransferase [Eubacteriales bacterium OttesenSCG-928-N13]|nr:glutamine amidotransferase [Eubacteriales bacterium OttesenSCG-928-N13]